MTRRRPKGHRGLPARLKGARVVICAGSGGVGKTTTSAAIAMGLAAQGARVAVVTIDPAKRLADALGLDELGNDPALVDPARFARRRRDAPRRAVGDDARRQAHVRRADRAPGARRGDPRRGARQPDLPAALGRGRRVAGVHRGRQALRPARLRPVRRPRPRHAAVAQRARLPRRARPPVGLLRRPRAEAVPGADRARGTRDGPRDRRRVRRPQPPDGRRPARRPVGLLPRARRAGRRVPRAGRGREGAAVRSGDGVPRRHEPGARARRGGDLLPQQAARVRHAVRRADRQPRAHPRRRRADGCRHRSRSPPSSSRTSGRGCRRRSRAPTARRSPPPSATPRRSSGCARRPASRIR